MKTMNIKPAFIYRFKDSLKGAASSFAILAIITFGFAVLTSIYAKADSVYTLSAYSFAIAIVMFVLGICTIRDDLRLCIQHGVSRRTVFVSEILSIVCISFILAVAGEILLAAAQTATASSENVFILDMYQMLYCDIAAHSLTLSQHLASILFNMTYFVAVSMAGMFISMVFYRLSKVWTIIVAVGVPILIFVGIPISLMGRFGYWLSSLSIKFIEWITSGVWAWALFCLAFTALTALFNYLLIRRAPIKAAKG